MSQVNHHTRSGEPASSVANIFQHARSMTVNAYSWIVFPEPPPPKKNNAAPELDPVGLNFASLVAG